MAEAEGPRSRARRVAPGLLVAVSWLYLAIGSASALAQASGDALGTEVLVRALSRDAKLIGDPVGGARVVVRDAASGKVLASGVTRGATGDTNAIMRERRGSSTDVFDTPGAAGWTAQFALTQPTEVRVSVEGPLDYPWAMARASKTLLLEPGASIGGGGLVLELHGFIVELLGGDGAAGGGLAVSARVRMLCSCPTSPDGLWSAGEVTARLFDGTELVAEAPLAYTGEDSRYGGELPRPPPGVYRLEVRAADPPRENFGRVDGTVTVPADGGAIRIEHGSPAAGAFTFPPEWAPHEAVWMGWTDYLVEGRNAAGLQALWAAMIRALTPHVAVRLVVADAAAEEQARTLLGEHGVSFANVVFHHQPTTDVWLRDSGPLFVTDGRTLELADFAWNYYGFPHPIADEAGHARASLDQEAAERLGLARRSSRRVAEGGGLEVNSRVLLTYRDTAQQRNPGVPLAEIEAEYLRLYGKEKVVWLDRAPISDRVFVGPKIANFFGWGANGHIDEYARFVDEDTILIAQVPEAHSELNALYRADDEILRENLAQLRAATDADGEPFEVIPVPMPDVTALLWTGPLTASMVHDPATGWDARPIYRDFAIGDEIHRVPAASYLNFLVTNGVVLVAAYWREGLPESLKETDEAMRAILAEQFPDREIVQIDPLAVNWGGGGMHCITQQQPRLGAPRGR